MLGVPNQGIWRLLSFKAIWKMGVDIVILTKTKSNKYATQCFSYSVCTTVARSSTQGGVAIAFNMNNEWFDTMQLCVWGLNVISIILTTG